MTDGECDASDECMGTVERPWCNPDDILGIDAAICIALAAGLGEGLHRPTADFTYDSASRRIVWNVQNVLSEVPDVGNSGEGVTIDAVTGEVLDSFGWTEQP